MAVGPAAGSKLFIGNAAPANPATDTYTEVGNISNMGEFGPTYSPITFDSLGNRLTQKFKGQRDAGNMQITLGRSPSDAGQALLVTARDLDFDYNFKVTLNDAITPPESSTVTITIATPGVVTWNNHGLVAGDIVTFSTTGALPTGLSPATPYYVISAGLTTSAFEVSATLGGSAINTTGTQSGTHTASFAGGAPTTFTFRAKVMGYTANVGAANNVVTATVSLDITSVPVEVAAT